MRMRRLSCLLLLGLWSCAALGATRDRDLKIEGSGGVLLKGILALPTLPAPPGKTWPVVVLMHHYGRNRDSLVPLVDALAEAGIGSVLMDMRGHGESRFTTDSKLFVFPVVGYHELRGGALDLEKTLEEVLKDPEVDKTRVAMAGVGIGALMVAETAARQPVVRALALVDPADPVAGYRPDRDLGLFGDRPVLLIPSGFPQSRSRAALLAEYGSGPREVASIDTLEVYDHLLQPGFPATARLLEWLKQVLLP